ncbi:MAG: PAS domain-containing sensor histidine kinase [Spartobacteria bacterium]|nr:PAS domain-containing sensor histidine kinase [Spartobacteria bacterium]
MTWLWILTLLFNVSFVLYILRANRRLRQVVNERDEQLEERQRAEAELRLIFNAAGDGMRVVDQDMRVVEVNERFLQMTGYTREEMIGERCDSFAKCDDLCGTEQCAVRLVMRNKAPRMEMDVRLNTKNGDLPCILSSVSYSNMDGISHSIVQNFKDIRDRLMLQQSAAQDAVQRGRLEMASRVLHDIGNAVTSIGTQAVLHTGNVEWMEQDALQKLENLFQGKRKEMDSILGEGKGEHLVRYLQSLGATVQQRRMDMIESYKKISSSVVHITGILDLQRRYAKGGTMAGAGIIRAQDVIMDAVAMQSASLSKRGIKVAYEVSNMIPDVRVDQTRLMQVLLNIVKNAYEAFDDPAVAENGRELHIKLESENDRVIITFVDNAIGFDPQNTSAVMESGYTTKPYGTGLGLAQCSSIIGAMDGEFYISSDGVGHGATVVLAIPCIMTDEFGNEVPASHVDTATGDPAE